MDGLRRLGREVNRLLAAGCQQVELGAFAAAHVHAKDRSLGIWRIFDKADPVAEKSQLFGPATARWRLPNLRHAADIGQERQPLAIWREARGVGAADVEVAREVVAWHVRFLPYYVRDAGSFVGSCAPLASFGRVPGSIPLRRRKFRVSIAIAFS